ncbi:tail fiber assembly protein [Enterobacter cloacae]|nr:tail fiber assembly protein [Enterobacter cloacae]
MITGKFTRYIPKDERLLNDAEVIKNNTGLDVIFLCDESGNDWYEIQSEFSASTIKIMYDEKGIVRAYSEDASSLNPINSYVAEVEIDEFPSGVDILGGWRFDGRKITHVEIDPVVENEATKLRLITEASAIIAPLQDAVELTMATEKEINGLNEWKKYRVLLSRVDPSNPAWPPKPTLKL